MPRVLADVWQSRCAAALASCRCERLEAHNAERATGILNHEVQCFNKWRIRELAKPPSRRLPPPERPELPEGDDAVETYNKLAQEASDRCRLCPCPKCGRKFEPDRLESHARTCEETPDPAAEPPPKHAWGPITRVGDGWELEELERFCRHRRRAEASAPTYFDDKGSVMPGVRHSGAVKTDRWDVNGLSKRELIQKINANLKRAGSAEAEANDAALWPQQHDFKEWLLEVFPAKQKIRQSVFSERLVPR